mgnify:CR=1 FL=1
MMTTSRRGCSLDGGFTLIELLVVVIILGILATVGGKVDARVDALARPRSGSR